MRRLLIGLCVALAASAVYLYAFPTATLIYEGTVVLHIVLGFIFIVCRDLNCNKKQAEN